MRKQTALAALVALMTAATTAADVMTLVDLPVSATANTAYMSSMSGRPWWNKAWTRRAPILVSSQAKVACGKALVDCIVDFGEAVNPAEVRVVTPWETEVPCVAEKAEGTAIRLMFQTALRIEENKPFLVYWGNPAAEPADVWSVLTLGRNAEEVRLANGILDVTFDNRHKTSGLLKKLRVVASQTPNELLERATGYAWTGFEFVSGRDGAWSAAKVIEDNAFVKKVRFESDAATLDFSLRADQPRLDWSYVLKGGRNQAIVSVSWAVGDGTGLDDFYYPGLSGDVLKFRASLDNCTDCIPNPHYPNMQGWFSEGWYAIRDRVQKEVVGCLFDRAALDWLDYGGAGQYQGERPILRLRHDVRKDSPAAAGSGALVATVGDVEEVSNEYARWAKPPRIFVGKPEGVREIPLRRPRLDRDFCADFNIGKGSGAGWDSGEPLEGTEWCSNIVDHIRSFGANAVRIGGYGWRDLPVTKDLYDRCVAAQRSPLATGWSQREAIPEWAEGRFTGQKFREYADAAHAKGLAVSLWTGFVPNVSGKHDFQWDPENNRLDLEIQNLYADLGADVVYNARACREGIDTPWADLQKYGWSFWEWENPKIFFDWEDKRSEMIRAFYRESKKRHPDTPVVIMNSESSLIGRETELSDQVGSFDTVYCEMLPLCDSPGTVPHTKQVVKRLRALFDNEAGRTVHSHFYYYGHNTIHRIHELELPFVFGANGFTFENLTYENFGRECPEITADFYRFLEYTKLGDKVARMGTVKNLAVFRDNKAFRNDICKHRKGKPYAYMTPQDGRANAFAEIRNYNYDIVVDRFLTAAALKKYRVVYIPEDEVLSADDARELVAYAKAGGGVALEGLSVGGEGAGCQALGKLGLKDGVVTPMGKGRIVWLKDCLTDRIARRDPKAIAQVKELVTSLGGVEPFAVEGSKTIDAMLQASGEGLFLGAINLAKAPDKGRVTLDPSALQLVDSSDLYVLNVRTGERFAYTNGFEIAAGANLAAFYLIGDEKFTALPVAKEGVWTGVSVSANLPKGAPANTGDLGDFKPAKALEFAYFRNGSPLKIRRSADAVIDVAYANPKDFDVRGAAKVLKEAAYVHVRAADSDVLFESCGEELKALLARGGSILFDRQAPGPKAQAFLASVGVFNPFAALTDDVGDQVGKWSPSVSTNHPCHYPSIAHPSFEGLNCGAKGFAKWDATKQVAPIVCKLRPQVGFLVAQEGVAGKGKVIFSVCKATFTDWYENKELGNQLIGWMIGCPTAEHAKKVELLNGGPGIRHQVK